MNILVSVSTTGFIYTALLPSKIFGIICVFCFLFAKNGQFDLCWELTIESTDSFLHTELIILYNENCITTTRVVNLLDTPTCKVIVPQKTSQNKIPYEYEATLLSQLKIKRNNNT